MKNFPYYATGFTLAVMFFLIGYNFRDGKPEPHSIKIVNGKSVTVIDPNDYDVINISNFCKTDTVYLHVDTTFIATKTIDYGKVNKPKKKHIDSEPSRQELGPTIIIPYNDEYATDSIKQ